MLKRKYTMKIYLRPHHLLCIQGYKGYNYNLIQEHYWSYMIKKIKDNPDADIFIYKGADDFCKNCPGLNIYNNFICNDIGVSDLDSKVGSFLGIVAGRVYKYKELLEILSQKMTNETQKSLCNMCAWWKKGFCHDSF